MILITITKNYERSRIVYGPKKRTVERGISYAKQGDYKKAMQCYQQALEVDPLHRDAYVAKGAAYANLNKLEEAVVAFEKALKIDPDDRNARKYLAATKEQVTVDSNFKIFLLRRQMCAFLYIVLIVSSPSQ